MNKVYVTGAGFITSIGNSYDAVFESLRTQTTGIERYSAFDADAVPVKVVGTIKGFDLESDDPEDWVYPKDYRPSRNLLRSLAPHGLYAYCAIEQALKQAGLDEEWLSNFHTGIHTASAGSPRNLRHHMNRMHELGVERLSPKSVVTSIAGTLNFCLVSHYKIKGNSCGFVSACASSGHALGYAFDEIRSGRQERVIVVGAEDGDLDTLLPFASMRAMSLEPDPLKACKPFDVDRSGFVGTGGAVALILESENSISARKAAPLMEMLGWAQTSDGYSAVLPEPDGEGLARAMQLALKSSELRSDEVDYLNAHATGTPSGDVAELRAIRTVFGEAPSVRIGATKALTGHGLSLSSILEAGLTLIALKEGFCPGTAHLEKPDPEVGQLRVLQANDDCRPSIALSNSSGFGGANVSLLFKSVVSG